MSVPHAKVIVNPVAGARSTFRKWPLISQRLREVGLSFDHEYTEGVGHAVELARVAASEGYQFLVAVGGDGTVNEVVNGILSSASTSSTNLGVVSTGTGSDFVRSVGIPRDCVRACSSLISPRRLLIDVGVVEYIKGGKTEQRFFINGAGVGFDAEVVKATESLPKYFGGTIPYVGGLLRSLFGYKNKTVTLKVGNREETKHILTIVVSNGRYFGGGMRVSPQAELDDNLFDVMCVSGMGKFELLKAFPSIYKGTHVTHPKVRMEKAIHIAVESSERVLVHADGELLGEAPVSFRLLPAVLNVVV